MSAPPSYALSAVRGNTWFFEFTYADDAGVPIDLTGYEARMQVREFADRYGTSAEPLLELLTTDATPLISWSTAADGRLVGEVNPDAFAMLNPGNEKKAKYVYAVEVFNATTGIFIPLVHGTVSVAGWEIR